MKQYYKRVLCILFCLAWVVTVAAQDQRYFVYIQSEKSQPFYVKYDGKVLSSSERGYIILPKLPAGTAALKIGFNKSQAPEQQFFVRLSGRNDQGFLLKQDGDNGYALYNLQTFNVIKPNENKQETALADAGAVPEAGTGTPEPAAAVADEDTARREMMASLKKDLDSTFAGKAEVGPGTRPVRQNNSFASALDKVVGGDRPELPVEEPSSAAVAAGAAAPVAAAGIPAGEGKKSRKKRRERAPLTEEEQQLLAQVLAEEQKAAASEAALEGAAVAGATEAAVTEEAPRKPRKTKKKAGDPDFIEFMDDSTQQQQPAPEAARPAETPEAAVPAPVVAEAAPGAEVATEASRKRKRRIADVVDGTEYPNNIITDSTGYSVDDLSIRHESKRERKKRLQEEKETGGVAAPVAGEAAGGVAVEEGSGKGSLPMINSDCEKVMDDAAFRKVLRKFVGAKDDDGMIDAFRRQTKGYCLETAQIKTLVQMLGTDESRYRLLDMGYPKVADSGRYGTLESLLKDGYYRGRFRAMLHK